MTTMMNRRTHRGFGFLLVGIFCGLVSYLATISQFQSLGACQQKIQQTKLSVPSLEADTTVNKTFTPDSSATTTKSTPRVEYNASLVEQYIMDNFDKLGYDKQDNPVTCNIWNDPNVTNTLIHRKINEYGVEVEAHAEVMKNFEPIPDLMKSIRAGEDINKVCSNTRPHPDGLRAMFPSNELSLSSSGYIDPLLPPMRTHKMCIAKRKDMLTLDYLVHDFEAMCHKLKPHSQLVLLDMGASLDFHGGNQPIMDLLSLYERFGFHFDHIYAFEITNQDPTMVYGEKLPEKYFHSYHWINVGVSAEEGGKLNPFHSILKKFSEDDLIIVKLDIDTSFIEVPLAKQLLEDKDDVYAELVDQFYFEYHVHQRELARSWRNTMEGSVKDSFELFQGLRKKGIASHFWP